MATDNKQNENSRTDSYGVSWYLTKRNEMDELPLDSVPKQEVLTLKIKSSTNHPHCLTIFSKVPVKLDGEPVTSPYNNKTMTLKIPICVGFDDHKSDEIVNPLIDDNDKSKQYDCYYELPHNFCPTSVEAVPLSEFTNQFKVTIAIRNNYESTFLLKGKAKSILFSFFVCIYNFFVFVF